MSPSSDAVESYLERAPETGRAFFLGVRELVQRHAHSIAGYLVERFSADAADLVSSTVARWDTEETSQRIELQVGRDLQWIRVNGTVVGGLAGLVIYTVAQLLG